MFYTIYKVTNKLNGKIYIGKHQTKNPNDLYYGSGKAILAAIKLHGKENFSKEILFIFDTEKEMNEKEKELITEEFVSRQDTYNLGVGGEGGPHFKGKTFSEESKKKMSRKGKPVSFETRMKLSNSNKGRIVSEETREKLSIAAKNRKYTKRVKEESKQKYMMSNEHKEKISLSLKKSSCERNENVSNKAICPHCNKVGQELAMKRHHFDNCKFK